VEKERGLKTPPSFRTGEALFGMGLSTFERTAFIGRTARKINSSDEMIIKPVSICFPRPARRFYKNATDLLSERKRFYHTARNTGKIGERKAASFRSRTAFGRKEAEGGRRPPV
jgi:hypothetical protein